MSPRRSSKSWSGSLARSLLLLAGAALAQDNSHTFTVSGNLPGSATFRKVQCKISVTTAYNATCYDQTHGGSWVCTKYNTQEFNIPTIYTPDRTLGFTLRSFPMPGFAPNWDKRTFTTGGYITNTLTPFVYQVDACAEVAEDNYSLTGDVAWYQATQGTDGKVTFSYVGEKEPTYGDDWPLHSTCDAANKSASCTEFLPMVKNAFNSLVLSGRIPGKALAYKGWDVLALGGGTAKFMSILIKTDPREFFQGSLPVSWFRDADALVTANADKAPYNLSVNEGFVASSVEDLPIYFGGGQYLVDDAAGKTFPETNGIKVRSYNARGSKIYKISELRGMTLEKLRHLPLPWMSKPLNQDHYAAWPNKDNPLQAVPDGVDWPPIPPDNVQNINPTTLASCPDMFQYYALFRECADNLADDGGVKADIGSFIDFLDKVNHDLQDIDGVRDYTTYRADGSIDPSSDESMQADKQYDIDDLRRLNPNNIVNQDPYQATRFWLTFRTKKYCWGDLCSVGKDWEPWWYDGYFKIDPSWIFQHYDYEDVDVSGRAKSYLTQMDGLFNALKVQRDLFAFDPWRWGSGKKCETSAGWPPSTTCADGFGVGAAGGKAGAIRYGDLIVTAHIDPKSYKAYQNNVKVSKFDKWRVFLGNPNVGGLPFENARSMVMEGQDAPMQIEREKFWTDWYDDMFRHYVVQEWPIIFQTEDGLRFPLGILKIQMLMHEDSKGGHNWIGNNFPDNASVHNDAPGYQGDDADKYDKKTSEYLTDKYQLDERDDMTWSEKQSALMKIGKYIAVSEGLDLLVKLAYNYRKEAWYLAQKLGLADAIKTTAKYVGAIYKAYTEYRSTMDLMREVRDASRRLKRNYRLLRATYKDVWNYYVHELDYSSIRPSNISKLMPIYLLGRADFAMWSTVSNLSTMAKNSHLLTLRFESYCTRAFGRTPQVRFNRNEQQEVAQILDQNSSDATEQRAAAFNAMRNGNPNLKEPDQVWKLSRLTEAFTKNIQGSGLWLENGYTRAAYNALAFVESDARSWSDLRTRTQWQVSNFGSIFYNQQSGKVQTNLATAIGRSAYVSRTPVSFVNPAFYPVESELAKASGSVLTCGGAACFKNP